MQRTGGARLEVSACAPFDMAAPGGIVCHISVAHTLWPEGLPATPAGLGSAGCGLGRLARGSVATPRGLPTTPLDVPLLLWLALGLFSTAFSIDPQSSLRGTWEAFTWVLILWMVVDIIRRGWGWLLWQGCYLVAGVVCLLGIIEFLAWYFGWPLLPTFQQGGLPSVISQPCPSYSVPAGVHTGSCHRPVAFLALMIHRRSVL